MDHAAFEALYGRWAGLAPEQVQELFAGAPFRWWLAGGWAIELASGVRRAHEDTDVVVLFDDLAAIRAHFAGFHLWEAHEGSLRPLLEGEELRAAREQLWVRRDASSPWLVDLLLTPSENGRWLFKRDRRISLPLDDLGDGVMRPEVVLLHKARTVRAKDETDFETALPALDAHARRWLDDALALAHPAHPWRERLALEER